MKTFNKKADREYSRPEIEYFLHNVKDVLAASSDVVGDAQFDNAGDTVVFDE